MKWILPAILLCLPGCHEPLRTPQDPPPVITAPAPLVSSPGIPATVISNHDGDSLTVQLDGQKVKVRIEGIDAPEKGQAAGDYSRSALTTLVASRSVRIAAQNDARKIIQPVIIREQSTGFAGALKVGDIGICASPHRDPPKKRWRARHLLSQHPRADRNHPS